jgi:copper chaperone
MRKLLTIKGMSCGHCVMHVRSALEGVSGVSKVEVDLLKGSAMVEGEALEPATLRAAVAEAGYEVTGLLP